MACLRDVASEWLAAGRLAVLVEVTGSRGSVPREAGTRMLVSARHAAGTVGGGHLELKAIEQARSLLASGSIEPQSVDLGQAWGWYAQVGKYIIPRKLELAVRYGFMDPSTKQKHDLTKEFGAAVNYSFDGTYNNRLIVDYSNITMGSGGRAPDRYPFENLPGFGRDLVENRINVQYQFYF